MKKLFYLSLSLLMSMSMIGCSSQSQESNQTDKEAQLEASNQGEEKTSPGKVLVAYFSRNGENYSVGYIEKGNTQIVAEMIADEINGELFQIQTKEPYPDSYDETTDIAQQELRNNDRPELAEKLESIDEYDTIYLGYPNWWGDMPMAVYTFLESYDFSNKTIVPFCTHGGSGLSSTESSIKETCPNATVLDGFSILGSTAQNSQDETKSEVENWLKDLGFIQ